MSWDRRAQRYQKFLKSLKRPESKYCSCPLHIHPRHWVPPPCLTSRTQKEDSFHSYKRTLSNPELRMQSTESHTKADDDSKQQTLQHLYNEARILKEAFNKVREGDHITKDSRNVIKKWSTKNPQQNVRSKTESRGKRYNSNKQIAELDKSFAEAVQEEEALKQELRNLREIAQNRVDFEEENKKLKKKIRHLQHRMKRQDEAQRVSRESLQAEREMGTREEYILLSLRKKYDDLLQYVLKVESENQKLKSLHGISCEDDEFLHDYERRNDCEQRDIARLQADLEALQTEVIKKDTHITECEERLQAMEMLKEENVALHKSMRNFRDTSSVHDPPDISTALEDEWMRRLAETREMYERAIEGYREQLQGIQENFQQTKINHASHINELMLTIDQLKNKVTPDDGNSDRSHRRATYSNSDQVLDHGKSRGTFVDRRRSSISNSNRSVDCGNTIDLVSDGSLDPRRSPSESNINANFTKNNGGKTPKRITIDDANMVEEEDRASISSEENNQPQHQTEVLPNRLKVSNYNDIEDKMRTQRREIKVSHKETQTQTKSPESLKDDNVSDRRYNQSEDNRMPEEMQQSKEYLERVNHLVKRLESLKLSGESTKATMSVIRDTINDCLHDWRECFQQQKTLHKDSADENKDYVELQRKLRSKGKQLESKQKQCKQLDEQNKKLIQQYNQLEAQMVAAQSSDRLKMLQDLPQTLHDTEERLNEFQEQLQRVQGEKISMQERIKSLIEKLNQKELKLANQQDQFLGKEEELKEFNQNITSLKHQLEENSKEVILLKEQLATKDAILEHTSAQLEERIRECAGLSSQIERQSTHMNTETRNIQVQLNEKENTSHKQLLEAQAMAARYQAQLSALRSEKESGEKSLRQIIRRLEEQNDQFQLRNSTLQRQMATISSTYHSMFTTTDINTLNPSGMDNLNAK